MSWIRLRIDLYLNLVTEIRLNDLLRFDNVAPGFICTIQVYGLDLPEKEKIKYLRHDAGFELWASLKLKQEDMTGKLQNRSLQIGQRAPRIPKLFGTIEMKLSGAIPVFCDIIKEGMYMDFRVVLSLLFTDLSGDSKVISSRLSSCPMIPNTSSKSCSESLPCTCCFFTSSFFKISFVFYFFFVFLHKKFLGLCL